MSLKFAKNAAQKTMAIAKLTEAVSMAIPKAWIDIEPQEVNYKFTENVASAIACAVAGNRSLMLTGGHGDGKSSSISAVSKIFGVPLTKISCHGAMRPNRLLGQVRLFKGEHGGNISKFIDGPLTIACRKGHWILLDELSALEPDVASILHSLCERDHAQRQLILEENPVLHKDGTYGPEVIKIHPRTRIFATSNFFASSGATKYKNTKLQSEAFVSRWDVEVIENNWDEETLRCATKSFLDKESTNDLSIVIFSEAAYSMLTNIKDVWDDQRENMPFDFNLRLAIKLLEKACRLQSFKEAWDAAKGQVPAGYHATMDEVYNTSLTRSAQK